MMNTIEAVVKNGQFVPVDAISLVDGTRALVTIVDEDEAEFWLAAGDETIDSIWNNNEDDIYAELLTR